MRCVSVIVTRIELGSPMTNLADLGVAAADDTGDRRADRGLTERAAPLFDQRGGLLPFGLHQ
jgi:hypothetical protein